MGINVHEIYFKKLSMTWLDKVYEQYRSSNMRVRSLKVGGRDLWCVKGAKNGYYIKKRKKEWG